MGDDDDEADRLLCEVNELLAKAASRESKGIEEIRVIQAENDFWAQSHKYWILFFAMFLAVTIATYVGWLICS